MAINMSAVFYVINLGGISVSKTCSTYRVISCPGDVLTMSVPLWVVEQQCGKELLFSVIVTTMNSFLYALVNFLESSKPEGTCSNGAIVARALELSMVVMSLN